MQQFSNMTDFHDKLRALPRAPAKGPVNSALQGHCSQNKGSTNSFLKRPQGKGPQ
jgi:hypothetical protein